MGPHCLPRLPAPQLECLQSNGKWSSSSFMEYFWCLFQICQQSLHRRFSILIAIQRLRSKSTSFAIPLSLSLFSSLFISFILWWRTLFLVHPSHFVYTLMSHTFVQAGVHCFTVILYHFMFACIVHSSNVNHHPRHLIKLACWHCSIIRALPHVPPLIQAA